MEIYHQRLKQLRENTDVTLKDMGKIIGVSEATVQRYESGKIHDLPYNVITSYAKKFNVKPEYIMGWTDEQGKSEVHIEPTEDPIRNLDYLKEYIIGLQEMIKVTNKEEAELIANYRKLPQDAKKRVLRYVDMELKG